MCIRDSPLLGAIEKEGIHSSYCEQVLSACKSKLKDEHSVDEIMAFTSKYVKNENIQKHSSYAVWPDHNSQQQMEFMLDSSNHLIGMHKDHKDLITYVLSEEVFKASGQLMLHDSWKMQAPIVWLNHDIIALQMAAQT